MIMFGLFDQEQITREYGEDMKAEGMETLNKLNRQLVNDNRLADLKRSLVDADYQRMLLREYGFSK